MKWLKRLTIAAGGTLVLLGLIATFGYLHLVNQVEKTLLQQGISEPNWQVATIGNSQVIFGHISFNYQNRYQVAIRNLTLQSAQGFDKSIQKQPIDNALIDYLSIVRLPETSHQITDNKLDIQQMIQQLPKQIEQLQQSNFNLALLPSTLQIKEINYQQPCRSQTCTLSASLVSKLNVKAQNITLKNQFSLADNSIPHMKLSNQLDISVPISTTTETLQIELHSDINKFKDSDDKLISIHLLSLLEPTTDKSQFLQLDIDASGDLPKLQHSSQGEAFLSQEWQSLFQLYQSWSGHTLEQNRIIGYLEKVNIQPDSTSIKRDFSLNTTNRINLNSIVSLDKPFDSIESESQLSLKLNTPLFIPNFAWIDGHLTANLSLQDGKIQSYLLKSQGKLAQLQTNEVLKQQGWQLNRLDFKFESQPSAKATTDLTTIPLNLQLRTAEENGNNAKEDISLNALANLSLKPLALDITSGKLQLLKSRLSFGKQRLTHLNTAIQFKGNITAEKSKALLRSVVGSANLYSGKNTVRVKNLKAKNVSIAFDSIKQALNSLHLKADSIQVSSNINTPELTVKNHILRLNKTDLKPLYNPKQQSLTGYILQSQYKDSLQQLDHTALKPMSWRSFGKSKIWLSESFQLTRAKVQGSISNHAGLVSFHNTTYTPNAISSDWEIPNIYFLAGNSLEKTLQTWPKLLTIGSGKLHAKGKLSLPLSGQSAKKPFLERLSLQAQIEAHGLSGIYNETTLNQLDLQSTLTLKNSHLAAKIDKLNLEQVNHGVIAGPIDFAGHYESKLKQLKTGKLTIKKASLNLFDGQASLPAQKIDLSQPFSSQLDLEAINLQALLQQYPSADIKGTGLVSGRLPFSVDLSKKPYITIQQGHLHAKQPGGTLRYQPSSSGLKQTHQSMKLVLNVLEDFHYQVLSSDVSFGSDKKLHLKLRLQGNNPAVENGRQVNFNIQLEEDLPALITSMQISNQVSETIKNRIQEKLQNKQ